eukprot:IDg15478t1
MRAGCTVADEARIAPSRRVGKADGGRRIGVLRRKNVPRNSDGAGAENARRIMRSGNSSVAPLSAVRPCGWDAVEVHDDVVGIEIGVRSQQSNSYWA